MCKKVYVLPLLLLSTLIISTDPQPNISREAIIKKAQSEIGQLQMAYEQFVRAYDREDIAQYESKLIKNLDRYYASNIKGTKISANEIRKTANSFLRHLLTLGTFDDAYGAASITFMLHWTKTITKFLAEIDTVEAKCAMEESVEEIRNLVEEVFVNPMRQRIASTASDSKKS